MTEPGRLFSEQEWLTLRFAAVWVVSALTGRCRFDDDERAAFWDAVAQTAVSSHGLARDVLAATAAERRWVFDEFELDDRPVVSGLLSVMSLLERVGADSRADVRGAVLRVGRAFALARGPFGRRVTTEDEQTLLLVEEILQTSAETVHDNPLNSGIPI